MRGPAGVGEQTAVGIGEHIELELPDALGAQLGVERQLRVLQAGGQRLVEGREQPEEAGPLLHVVAVVRPEDLHLVEADDAVASTLVVVGCRRRRRRRHERQHGGNDDQPDPRSPHVPPRSPVVQPAETLAHTLSRWPRGGRTVPNSPFGLFPAVWSLSYFPKERGLG